MRSIDEEPEDPGHGGEEPGSWKQVDWAGGHPEDVAVYRREQEDIEETEEEEAELTRREGRDEDQAIERWLERRDQDRFIEEAGP